MGRAPGPIKPADPAEDDEEEEEEEEEEKTAGINESCPSQGDPLSVSYPR